MLAPDPARAREIAHRLIRAPSVSPDVAAETRCARVLAGFLPLGLVAGEWLTRDGRPAIWALLRGRSPRTVVMLGHYDTVDVAEYAALGDSGVACDPEELLARFRAWMRDAGSELPARVRADLEEEERHPGTWLFGRGALDMKSGLAAGIAALEALASGAPIDGCVLFVATLLRVPRATADER